MYRVMFLLALALGLKAQTISSLSGVTINGDTHTVKVAGDLWDYIENFPEPDDYIILYDPEMGINPTKYVDEGQGLLSGLEFQYPEVIVHFYEYADTSYVKFYKRDYIDSLESIRLARLDSLKMVRQEELFSFEGESQQFRVEDWLYFYLETLPDAEVYHTFFNAEEGINEIETSPPPGLVSAVLLKYPGFNVYGYEYEGHSEIEVIRVE